MKIDWNKFLGKTLNVTLNENYGLAMDPAENRAIYEIVFKTGKLTETYDDGFLLESKRENESVKIFVPYGSIKCVEIFNF